VSVDTLECLGRVGVEFGEQQRDLDRPEVRRSQQSDQTRRVGPLGL
jgi:hypothetical protein